ncbi:hypothetical protein [Plantactinospora sp. KBS50]|uniref:hypothetical protein n=1 Tax=Plantactinospora sp. KBS50 TaxID=2024580 RepID=UPI0018DF9415|nr:hypothetical protein [Plantactinospora sp. KBS50]
MGSALTIALFVLAGVLLGGVVSMHRQGAGRGAVALVAVLALLATAGGLTRLFGDA